MNKSQLVKCLKCRAINVYNTPYFRCYNCPYVNEKDISYQVNEFEQEQRKIVKKIVEFLFFSLSIPSIEFPEFNTNPKTDTPDWGWIDWETRTIFLPRKTFYLPNDELTDTTVHEVCHLLSEIKHNRTWYLFYLKQREKTFNKFSDFVNSVNPQGKFEKGYKIYPEHYVVS